MCAPKKMTAGSYVGQRIHRLSVNRVIDPGQKHLNHPGLVRIQNELLVTHGEPALEPAGGVQHEIDSRQHGALQGVGGFIGCLGIREFRSA